MQRWQLLILLIISAAFTGCASIPQPLAGDYPGIKPEAVSSDNLGVPVRWGGTIIATTTEKNRTCIEILGRELDPRARPIFDDSTEGRFIACKNGFQDPQIFSQGREVTITGRVDEIQTQEVGEFEYQYPVVDTKVLYLWPERFGSDYYGYAPPSIAYAGGPVFYPFARGYFNHGLGFGYGSRFGFGHGYGYGFGHGFGFRSRFGFGHGFGFGRGFGFGHRGFGGFGHRGFGRFGHRGFGHRGFRRGFSGGRRGFSGGRSGSNSGGGNSSRGSRGFRGSAGGSSNGNTRRR